MKLLIRAKMSRAGQMPTNLQKIILIRHADSCDRVKFAESCKKNGVAHDDLERPLSKKGKAQSKKIASFLKARKSQMPISLVLYSPAKRTKQTIKPFLKSYKGAYSECKSIAPDCGIDGYLSAIKNAKNSDTIALVGHQFDLGNFVEYATGLKQNVDFKKGVIVEIARKMGAKTIKNGFVLTLLITPEYL